MASIQTLLQNIMNAIYGEEVRGSIHDAIEAINDEVEEWTGLQDGTVTTAKLANNAVTTAKVADGAITREKLNSNVVDNTLSVSGAPADAKKVGDKVSELKTAFKDADNTITRKMILIESDNKWNQENEVVGYITKAGVSGVYDGYAHLSKPLSVSEGDVVRFYCINSNGNIQTYRARWLCAYDSNMNVVESAGSNTEVSTYTVPSGVSFINPTMATNVQKLMLTINKEATAFNDYFAPYYKASEGFIENMPISDTDFEDVYMDFSMVNRLDPSECLIGKMLPKNGTISDSSNYAVTGYMKIRKNETISIFKKNDFRRIGARFICAYDADKNVIESAGTNSENYAYTQTGNVAFIRCTVGYRSSDVFLQPSNYMAVATQTPSEAVDYGNEPVFQKKYIPRDEQVNLHVYLPPEIPVGIGRTIELYNELVCLESNKYHLHYSCSVGVQYSRKFSITGTTAGSYTLRLDIYNDNMERVWTGTSTINVVANSIASELKVLPIGDSLTNGKAWLSEVQNLSNGKIKFIGTRGRSDNTIRHEGRSGGDAEWYDTDGTYTFDSGYQGNPSVDGTSNPFWDGAKFSLSHYIDAQSAYVGTPNAVQIFLGTNGIALDPTENVTNIKALVDYIRNEYPSMPIFVCNTIYRSNQNGYYSTGADGFVGSSEWAFDADTKIMNLQNALAEALTGYTNVYIVPLSVCMDRENDFGQVEVAVNPRLTDVTINIPNQSVHPQEAGYMQIADVIYSSYIAHLS